MSKKIQTLKGKLLIYNLFVICAVVIFISLFSYFNSEGMLTKQAKISLVSHVNGISARLSTSYEEMLNIVLNCSTGAYISLDNMNLKKSSKARRQALQNYNLLEALCNTSESGSYIAKLMVVYDKDNFIQKGTISGSFDDAKAMMDTEWFQKELDKTIDFYNLDMVASPYFAPYEWKILPIVHSTNIVKDNNLPFVFLGISQKMFYDVLSETDSGNQTFVVTSSGAEVASINIDENSEMDRKKLTQKLINSSEAEGIVKYTINNQKCIVAYQRYVKSGITVCEILNPNTLVNARALTKQTIIIMFISSLSIGLFFMTIVTNHIEKPIKKLISRINRIASGDFSRDRSVESNDEIGKVGHVVNQMAVQIEELIKNSVIDEKEKKNLEIKMLQSQINPHFLYNTLDSIRWVAMIQNNSGIVKVVTALSKLLENMAKGYNEKVTLRQELDFLNDYIVIAKFKYVELFDVDIDIKNESLYDANIIKLTLQPLVENAIFSGIEPSKRTGKIVISAWEKDNSLYVSVKDDGIGMSQEKIKTVLEDTENVKKDSMSGVGLPNVDRRIKLVYGEEYGLTISSTQGDGTQVVVKIPLEYKNQSEVKDNVSSNDCR